MRRCLMSEGLLYKTFLAGTKFSSVLRSELLYFFPWSCQSFGLRSIPRSRIYEPIDSQCSFKLQSWFQSRRSNFCSSPPSNPSQMPKTALLHTKTPAPTPGPRDRKLIWSIKHKPYSAFSSAATRESRCFASWPARSGEHFMGWRLEVLILMVVSFK